VIQKRAVETAKHTGSESRLQPAERASAKQAWKISTRVAVRTPTG